MHIPDHSASNSSTVNLPLEIVIKALQLHTTQSKTPVTASRLRVIMSELTNGGFQPITFGYPKFRGFLDALEEAGIIEIDRSHPGDLRILRKEDNHPQEIPFLREDLWKAIIDWSQESMRYWDKNLQVVQVIPCAETELDPPQLSELRKKVRETPSRFISIPKITVDQQFDILKSFIDDAPLPSDSRLVLAQALNTPKPFKRTIEMMRSMDSSLEEAWASRLREAAWQTAKTWKENTSTLSEVTLELFQRQTLGEIDVKSQHPLPTRHQKLRTMAHNAINRMTADQLASMNFPIGTLIDDE